MADEAADLREAQPVADVRDRRFDERQPLALGAPVKQPVAAGERADVDAKVLERRDHRTGRPRPAEVPVGGVGEGVTEVDRLVTVRDSVGDRRAGAKQRVLEPERVEDPATVEVAQLAPRNLLNDSPQQQEVQVRIRPALPGRAYPRLADRPPDRAERRPLVLGELGGGPGDDRRQIGVAARVVEELADRDLAPAGNPVDVVADRVVDTDLTLLDELHHERAGKRLRDAADPGRRAGGVGSGGRDIGDPRRAEESALPACPDTGDDPGIIAARGLILDRLLEGAQLLG